jgi:hypothetical protein
VLTRTTFSSKKITGFLLTLAIGFAAFAFTASTATADEISTAPSTSNNVGTYSQPGTVNPDATVVTVGFYGVNAYEIDTSSNTFYFKGYMWLRWAGDVDPISTLEFANSVEEWGLMVTNLTEAPQKLPNGEQLQVMRVQGRFFEPFDLASYPLDKQQLNIYLEDSVNDENTVVYQADSSASGYDASFKVPGWNLNSLGSEALVHNYNSNFGDPAAATTGYSALRFNLNIERVQNLFWWKLLLPLLLVLITNWLALLLSPRFAEIRTAMPATALLTTVFLQQSSLDAIPQVSSLVLMDFIYVLAYLMIVVTFAQIVWDNHRTKLDDEVGIARIQKLDRWSILVQVAAFAIGLAVLVTSAL